jgi:hypothetical protein
MNQIAEQAPDPKILIFVDEVVKNKWISGRSEGWSLQGMRYIQKGPLFEVSKEI